MCKPLTGSEAYKYKISTIVTNSPFQMPQIAFANVKYFTKITNHSLGFILACVYQMFPAKHYRFEVLNTL